MFPEDRSDEGSHRAVLSGSAVSEDKIPPVQQNCVRDELNQRNVTSEAN